MHCMLCHLCVCVRVRVHDLLGLGWWWVAFHECSKPGLKRCCCRDSVAQLRSLCTSSISAMRTQPMQCDMCLHVTGHAQQVAGSALGLLCCACNSLLNVRTLLTGVLTLALTCACT
jgi:hypothetical protein